MISYYTSADAMLQTDKCNKPQYQAFPGSGEKILSNNTYMNLGMFDLIRHLKEAHSNL